MGMGTEPADMSAAGPVIWQTWIFMFTLYMYQLSWNEPRSFCLFVHCRFL